MSESKREMRRIAAEKEKNAGETYLRESDAAAFRTLFSLPEYRAARTVFCYLGVGTEPDTRAVIARALSDGKTVALPRVVGKGHMEARLISALSDLTEGTFGIPEPSQDTETLDPAETDLAIVPAAAFDREGYRLGRGGGYYDRYLARFGGVSVGLARERLLRDAVPREAHDRPVDILITECGVIKKGRM